MRAGGSSDPSQVRLLEKPMPAVPSAGGEEDRPSPSSTCRAALSLLFSLPLDAAADPKARRLQIGKFSCLSELRVFAFARRILLTANSSLSPRHSALSAPSYTNSTCLPSPPDRTATELALPHPPSFLPSRERLSPTVCRVYGRELGSAGVLCWEGAAGEKRNDGETGVTGSPCFEGVLNV